MTNVERFKQLVALREGNVFSWDSACRENPFWSLATLPARDYLLAWEAIGIAGGKLELRVQMGRFDISEEPLAKAIAFENQIDAMREKAFAGMEP